MNIHYTIGFDAKEKLELLEIFKDNLKWRKRIEEGFGFLVSDGLCKNCSAPAPVEGVDFKMIDNGSQPSGIQWIK